MKLSIHEKFVTDDKGRKKEVILSLTEYQKILNLLEDLADISYIKKHKKDERITIEEFISQIVKIHPLPA